MSLHLLEDDIPPAWVWESDKDLRMDMKMMIKDSQSLPENIHAVVFINDNHTARLLGGSGKLPILWADLQNPVSMIFQHSTFFHSELTDTLFWAWSFILKSAMISQHSHSWLPVPNITWQAQMGQVTAWRAGHPGQVEQGAVHRLQGPKGRDTGQPCCQG